MLKDALAIAALVVWLGVNLWLWAAEISLESRFIRSLFLGVVGYTGFFGYLSWRNRG